MKLSSLALGASALVLAACSESAVETQEVVVVEDAAIAGTPVAAAPVPSLETVFEVTVMDGYVMEPLMGRDVTAGYFSIRSDRSSERVISASSPSANTVELHTHTMVDGVMKMREVDGIDLPQGETVTLEPGGLHLMMFGFANDEAQTEILVTLLLESGQTVDLFLPLRAR
jgi:hypothetical protein